MEAAGFPGGGGKGGGARPLPEAQTGPAFAPLAGFDWLGTPSPSPLSLADSLPTFAAPLIHSCTSPGAPARAIWPSHSSSFETFIGKEACLPEMLRFTRPHRFHHPNAQKSGGAGVEGACLCEPA